MDLAEGWKVVAYGNVNSYLDQNLSNGKTYYYLIYTFDPANEYQQGRNYSAGVKISGVPGQKPAAVKNLVALTSGEAEILLQWEIANKSEYGGSIIRYATDNSKKWDAVPNFEADPNFIPTIDQPDQNPGDPNAVTEKYLLPNLTPDLTHYFQVYSYNQAEDPLNRKYADIGAKGAAVPGKPAAAGTISNFKINSFNIANKQITLTWDITAGKVCEVYKSTDPKVFTAANLIQGGAGINAYTYTLGPQETEAYFRVKISGDNQPWAPETLGVKKFNLIKNTTGINSIAIPFVQFSADSLKESINNQAGKEIVEYVAGWDETNQKEYARIYSGGQIKNIGNKANFVISPWVGYQISVNESMNNCWVNGKVSGK
jgi:hypothetical protein